VVALGAGTAGAQLAVSTAGADPSLPAPAVAVGTRSVLAVAGPGHVPPLVGSNAGFCVTAFPSAFFKAGVWGAQQLGFLSQWESRAELSTRTGVTCVPNS